MSLISKLDAIHLRVRKNKWMWFFTIFNRMMLALGFIPAGIVKLQDERFTALATEHPMGSFLEAFYHTGFYYPFVGAMQVLAAIFLLIPRTATIGALIYFPIILNICLLSIAVRFDGSLLTAPLMVMSCLYLLCWDWHKIKFIFYPNAPRTILPTKSELSNSFPFKFFAGSAAVVLTVIGLLFITYNTAFMPRNNANKCKLQCADNENPEACIMLCDCIHSSRSYNHCMKDYYNASATDQSSIRYYTRNK